MKQIDPNVFVRNPRFVQGIIIAAVALVVVCLCLFYFTQVSPIQNLIGNVAQVPKPTSTQFVVQTFVLATPPPTAVVPATFTPVPSPTSPPTLTPTRTLTPTVTRTPTLTPTVSPWITLGQYKVGCNSEIDFDAVNARRFRFQVIAGGGDDRLVSFYCCTSQGAGWLVNGVWIPVTFPTLTLRVGDLRETAEFTPTLVSKMRFNVGCNDNEQIDARVSYLPGVAATPTITATATLTATPGITVTATLTPTAPITATVTPTATVPVTPTATPVARPPAPRGSIAFHLNDRGIDRVRVYSFETNNITPLEDIGPVMDLAYSTSAAFGAWAPDNSKFAYIWAGSPGASNILSVLDFRTNTSRALYSSDTGGGLSSPTWSPDGTKLAFIRLAGNQRMWSVIVINADGTRCSEKYECEITANTQGEQFRGGLVWSSKGLYFLAINSTGANDVYSMWSNGGGRTNLTNHPADDSTPAISPDGNLIAFTSNRTGRPQIYVMNADGSGLRRVSQDDASDWSPSWSPDGNWIAFASTRAGVADIYIMDVNGGNVTRVTTTGGDRPIWSR